MNSFNFMIVSPALAASGESEGGFGALIIVIGLFILFYLWKSGKWKEWRDRRRAAGDLTRAGLGDIQIQQQPLVTSTCGREKDLTTTSIQTEPIPWFGTRNFARKLQSELRQTRGDLVAARTQLDELGALPVADLQNLKDSLETQIASQRVAIEKDKAQAAAEVAEAKQQLASVQAEIVATDENVLLQEAGVYHYRHPLSDVVAYERRLEEIEARMKQMNLKDGGAVLADKEWSVNGSASAGRIMIRDSSKLVLRAFNAEADTLVRGLKPYKLDAAIRRLKKSADIIAKLGKTMHIRISTPYLNLRIAELELTADYLAKREEQKDAEREERERLREERKAQQEMQRERLRLEKEKQHNLNALQALKEKGDQQGVERIERQLAAVRDAIENVNSRAANTRTGFVYVISNIGAFGPNMVKVGLTRRLQPSDRIRELGDASVPFKFDTHVLHFSQDAVDIENKLHERLAHLRVNTVNPRREFFYATPALVKAHLSELAGELLEFKEQPEAIEYRESLKTAPNHTTETVQQPDLDGDDADSLAEEDEEIEQDEIE